MSPNCLLVNWVGAIAALATLAGFVIFPNPFTFAAIIYTLITGGFSADAFVVAFEIGCYS
jgi:hypothetical protein